MAREKTTWHKLDFYQEMKIEIVEHILQMDVPKHCSHVSDEIFNTITVVCSKMVTVFRTDMSSSRPVSGSEAIV